MNWDNPFLNDPDDEFGDNGDLFDGRDAFDDEDDYSIVDPLASGPDYGAMDDSERALWKQVLEHARYLYKLKPWAEFDTDTWVSIEQERSKFEDATVAFMGQRRSDYALQFFLSEWGRWCLSYMKENEAVLSRRLVSRALYRLNAYRIDFVAADDLPDRYRMFIRDLGLSFRGNWPYLTSLMQSKVMTYPTRDELEHLDFLMVELIQTVEDVQSSKVSLPRDEHLLKRYWSFQDQRWLYRELPLKAHVYLPVSETRDELAAKRIAKQEETDQRISIDLFRFRNPFVDADRSLILPSCFIATDDDTAQIVKVKLMGSLTNELTEWEDFILELIRELGKPESLNFDDEVTYEALEPFFDAIDLSVALMVTNPDHDLIFEHMDHQFDLF